MRRCCITERSDGSLWQSCQARCAICSHEWVAVFPIEATELECPHCSYVTPLDIATTTETE